MSGKKNYILWAPFMHKSREINFLYSTYMSYDNRKTVTY